MENHDCGHANSRENVSDAEYAEPLDAKAIFLESVSLYVMVFETEESRTFSGMPSVIQAKGLHNALGDGRN